MLVLKTALLLLAWSSTCLSFSTDLPALQTILSFLIGKNASSSIALGNSVGHSELRDVLTLRDKLECTPDDYYILHLKTKQSADEGPKKPPILIKCLQAPLENDTDTNNTAANITFTTGKLLMMTSVKEIVALLKPIGNATKRHEIGSCVLVFFHSPTSLSCAQVAPHANLLPALFPTLRVAAIDAFEFSSFNTEFGIVGLPTLLLFHQGRPIVKFYSDVGTFAAFVTRHTGIKPLELNANLTEELKKAPLPLEPVHQVDYLLILAWVFILLCAGNYISKTQWCLRFVDVIKRNWRESEEAQMGPN